MPHAALSAPFQIAVFQGVFLLPFRRLFFRGKRQMVGKPAHQRPFRVRPDAALNKARGVHLLAGRSFSLAERGRLRLPHPPDNGGMRNRISDGLACFRFAGKPGGGCWRVDGKFPLRGGSNRGFHGKIPQGATPGGVGLPSPVISRRTWLSPCLWAFRRRISWGLLSWP